MSIDSTTARPAAGKSPASGELRASDKDERNPGAQTDRITTTTRRIVPFILLVTLFALLARYAARPLSNPDTFFHLRFGREFLTGAWSLRDPGSVTSQATADWVPTQWSAQVLMAQAEQWFGLPGVAWLDGLQLLALAVCLYASARRRADPLVAVSLTLLAVLGCAPGLSARPQVMSYVLVSLVVSWWLDLDRRGSRSWMLIPLAWVWATYHGMWPLGLIVSSVILAGLYLDHRLEGRAVLRHGVVLVAAGAAPGLTPVGPRLYGAVLSVSSRGQYFSEWAPPDFGQYNNLAALAVVGLTAAVALRTRRREWTTLLLIGLALLFLVYSQRTVPAAMAVALPVGASVLQPLIGTHSPATRAEKRGIATAVAATLVTLGCVVGSTAASPAPQPSWVGPGLRDLPAGTRVLTDTSFGGYVMWIAPQVDVVLSGYGDIYTDAEMRRNADIEHLAPGWDDELREMGPGLALVSTKEPLGYALEQAGWQVRRSSPSVELLAAPASW